MQSAKDWDGSNVADPLNNALQGCDEGQPKDKSASGADLSKA